MNDKAVISLKDVSLTYKVHNQFLSKKRAHVQALHEINLDIFRGEKVGVIGRNGSGKSTLMKILSGIISPDKGKVATDPAAHVQLLSLGVGLEGHLSGRENAILNGMLLGKSRKYMVERVEAIKEFSELGDFFDYPVNTYSSGMVTRLGFSVALEVDPDVLLIDEVLGVGDASFYQKSNTALRERMTDEKAVVLISHDANTIRDFCDRAIWIDKGQVVSAGSVEEVCGRYQEHIMNPVG